MSEKEKEAILELKHFINMTAYWKQEEYTNSEIDSYIKMVLNLIKKQEKIIDEMADNIFNIIDYGTFIEDIEDLENETKVKQYFYRKVEEDG